MSNVAIIGAGVTGSVIARVLDDAGHKVAVIDDFREGRATPASAGIMHPNWMGAFDKGEVFAGLALLDKLFGLRYINFPSNVCPQVSPNQYDWEKYKGGVIKRRVTTIHQAISKTQLGLKLELQGGGLMFPDYVIVATGCWANELVPTGIPEVRAAAGTAFLYEGYNIQAPLLRTWAPYKQLMAFNRDTNTIWAGDGTSMLPKNYTPEREQASFERIKASVGFTPTKRVTGWRPTVVGQKGGVCKQIYKRTWVVTGGSKNGTIFAAIAANRLVKEIK